MNFIQRLISKIKDYIFPRSTVDKVVEQYGGESAISQSMEQNINLWYAMYQNTPPWEDDRIRPLGLPSSICREVSRATMLEFKAEISGGKRAEYLQTMFDNASEHFLKDVEMGLALGGVAFKPYVYNDQVLVDATGPAGFQPTRFDPSGMCIGGVFKNGPVKVGNEYYIRLEYHDMVDGVYVIRNTAYKSDESGDVLDEVSLSTVKEWADLQEETPIQGLKMPLFAYFRTPGANNVDISSMAGVSIYSGAAVDLIKQADEQWQRIQWEYESGKRKIFVDGTQTAADKFDRDLFTFGAFSSNGEFFETFSPDFRNEPLYSGLQYTLRRIEFCTGLSYGTISDPQSVALTATEIRNSKQRMYVTVDSIQKALGHTFDTLIYAMDFHAALNKLSPAGDYEVHYDWGDSVLEDQESREKEFARDMQLMTAGILNDWEVRSKWLGEDAETAKASLPKMEDMVTEPQDEIE